MALSLAQNYPSVAGENGIISETDAKRTCEWLAKYMIIKNGAGTETRTRIQSLFRETLLEAEKRPKRSPEESSSYEGGIISKVLTSVAVLINELQGDINRVSVLADLHTLADKYQPRQKQHNDKDGNKGKRRGEGDSDSKPEHPKKSRET